MNFKEMIGQTQTSQRGLGAKKMEKWSKATGKSKKDMVLQELRRDEEAKRIQKAVQQSQQGQWTTWENAIQRSLSWNDLWHMAPLRISFILRSVYDILPSNTNLVKWGKSSDSACPLCQGKQAVEHVLSSCKTALSSGRCTWRHNQVLKEVAQVVSDVHGNKTPESINQCFYSAKRSITWPENVVSQKVMRRGLLDGADDWDWECSVDLPGWRRHPGVIAKTGMRSDKVLCSPSTKQLILIELTVPYET